MTEVTTATLPSPRVIILGRKEGESALSKDNPNNKLDLAKENTSRKNVAIGLGLAGAAGLGLALKGGVTEGFQKIATIGRKISSFFGLGVVFLYPLATLFGEYEEKKGKNESDASGSKIMEITNPLLSLAFAPMTAFEPLEKATQSTGHMIAGLINMPHLIFTFFSYTGGRFMTLVKSLQINFSSNQSEEKRDRLEKERTLLSTLGNIGSDNAAITPQAHQFATGINTWGSLLTGNIDSVKETFSEAPVTTFLGTFISTFTWIPSLIGKTFDTSIRTLEMTDQLKNVFSEDSKIYQLANNGKEWWHKTSQKDSFFGNMLSMGRSIGKFTQATMSPLGMVSVVFPAWDHFFKNGFNNPNAREAGGLIAGFDKILNIGAFAGHCYFTLLYGLFIRLPQTVVTSSFYICHGLNKMRGISDKPNDSRYLDPAKFRDKLFNPTKGWAKSLSDFAQKRMEKLTGKSTMFDNLYKVLAEQECYRPLRETLYQEYFQKSFKYKDIDTGEEKEKDSMKEPPPKVWNTILIKNKQQIITNARENFKKYLRESVHMDENAINEFFYKTDIYKKIESELEKIIDNEIKATSGVQNHDSEEHKSPSGYQKPKLKSKSFFDMLKNPIKYASDLKEVCSFKHSISQFVLSPLNILDFVNVVDLGNKDYSYTINKFLLEESSIRNGDFVAGVVGELPTVLMHDVQTAGDSVATLYNMAA